MRWKRGLFVIVVAAGGLLAGGCGLLDSSVDSGEIESKISESLEAQFGEAPADVDCPDDLDADVDATTRCTITASDGTQIGATVTVTGVDGTDVTFDFEVDDEPISSAPAS